MMSAEIAWKLFEFIAEKDPASVGTKEDAIATFKACLAALRDKADEWEDMPDLRLPGDDPL